jgi:branched-chain amino acid transport system substrate-binding protein
MGLMATHFRNTLGFATSAIVENSWWPSPGDFYSNAFTAQGGTVTSRRVATDTSYFTPTLLAIQTENPDVIVNVYMEPNPGVAGGRFSQIAHNLGMTDVVIGWNSDSNNQSILDTYAGAAGSAAAENDYVAMRHALQDMPGWPAFLAAYQAAGFANEPDDPGNYGPYAFDAAGLVVAAMDRADSPDPATIRDEIAATADYQGVVGTYEGFDSSGDVIPQWARLYRYQNGRWGIAPSTWVFLPVVFRTSGP